MQPIWRYLKILVNLVTQPVVARQMTLQRSFAIRVITSCCHPPLMTMGSVPTKPITVRRAFEGVKRNNLPKKMWVSRLRGWIARRSPSLSEMLPPPDYLRHPFSSGTLASPAWYALLVPTQEEGHDVLSLLPQHLAKQTSDFTVFVGFAFDDSTKDKIYAASALDPRIVPVSARSANTWDLELALEAALRVAEDNRDRSVTDAIFVPLPTLIIKRR